MSFESAAAVRIAAEAAITTGAVAAKTAAAAVRITAEAAITTGSKSAAAATPKTTVAFLKTVAAF